MMNKQEARALLRARRPDADLRAAESNRLCRYVAAWSVFRQAETVASFLPLPWEADISPINDLILRQKTLLLPKVNRHQLNFCRVTHLDACRPVPPFGIPEPPEDAPLYAPDRIDLLLVPLEGLDASGHRLGKGGGYYDRYLTAFTGVACGIALSYQWMAQIPTDPWDQPLSYAVSPDGCYDFQNGGLQIGKSKA